MANHAVTTHTIPCLSDNYAFLIHDHKTGTAAIVDVPEAKPLLAVSYTHLTLPTILRV